MLPLVTKLLSSNCGAHLVESYYKESNISDTNWLRYMYPFSTYLTPVFDQNLVACSRLSVSVDD